MTNESKALARMLQRDIADWADATESDVEIVDVYVNDELSAEVHCIFWGDHDSHQSVLRVDVESGGVTVEKADDDISDCWTCDTAVGRGDCRVCERKRADDAEWRRAHDEIDRELAR